MKYFAFALLMSQAFADQGKIVAEGRDKFIQHSIKKLQKYCKDQHFQDSPHAVFICRLQVVTDCENFKKGDACLLLSELSYHEKTVIAMDKIVHDIAPKSPIPLWGAIPPERNPAGEHHPQPVMSGIEVRAGVGEEWHDRKNWVDIDGAPVNPQPILEDFKNLQTLRQKINKMQVRIDCSVDDDCVIQDFGRALCGGPMGSFVYSVRDGSSTEVIKEVEKFNQADRSYQDKWSRSLGGLGGLCVFLGRSTPSTCVANLCR